MLYDMLLSAGGFAVYLSESNVFGVLAQRFGDLSRAQNRRRLMAAWLESKLFRASGLEAAAIEAKIAAECRNYGDFLRITMGEIARSQHARRWAENTPEHILYAPVIKALIPDALFIHMIRDGRAVALSLDRRVDRGLQVLPWDRKHNRLIQGIYWEWIVQRGRNLGAGLAADYLEVRFEDLVCKPQQALEAVGGFIDQKLNYERIQEVAYRTVRHPNTSFGNEDEFDPVDRWRAAYAQKDLQIFEDLAGDLLVELGYPVNARTSPAAAEFRRIRAFYRRYFAGRFWLKTSALGRLRPRMNGRRLDEIVMGEDRAPALAENR